MQRWRVQFFNVWDAAWQNDDRPIRAEANNPDWRLAQRPFVVELFNCLHSIAHHWEEDVESGLILPQFELPRFSIGVSTDSDGRQWRTIERFTNDMITFVYRELFYMLSPDVRQTPLFVIDDVIAAVDILGFLCAKYSLSPDVRADTVRAWREITLQLDTELNGEWDTTGMWQQNVIGAFDRLEAVAAQFPQDEWWRDDADKAPDDA